MKRKLSLTLLGALLALSLLAPRAWAAKIADMAPNDWAYPYVTALVNMGVMQTDEYAAFYPDVPTTRGEFVTYLWRAFGSPSIYISTPTFQDVSVTSRWLIPVEWAYRNNITGGVGDGRFAPDQHLTREQAFTFLYRAMKYLGVAPSYADQWPSGKPISSFADYASLSSWAADPVQLLLNMGIVTGSDTNFLSPKQDVANAETAAILYRAMEYMGLLDRG